MRRIIPIQYNHPNDKCPIIKPSKHILCKRFIQLSNKSNAAVNHIIDYQKRGLLPMAENDSYDTFKSNDDSSITLLFCKKRTESDKNTLKTLTILCTLEVEY